MNELRGCAKATLEDALTHKQRALINYKNMMGRLSTRRLELEVSRLAVETEIADIVAALEGHKLKVVA